MKRLLLSALTCSVLLTSGQAAFAQTESNRTNINLTISYGGKTITTELTNLSFSLGRYGDEADATLKGRDTAKKPAVLYKSTSAILSMEVKRVSDDMLRVFSKKQNRFDGTISIVDNFGKLPTRTIKFKQASLSSYSDQYSAASYGEYYGASSISINCSELSINGITVE